MASPQRSARWLFDLYLFGNVHIALCSVALTLTTAAILDLHLRRELLLFVFCGTFFGYNLQRLPSALADKGIHRRFRRHHWETQHGGLLTAFSVLAATAFAWSASRLYLRSQILAVVPAALSYAYAFPFIFIKHKWVRLREVPGMKIFVIAVTWACSCAVLPIVAAHRGGEPWFSPAALLWALACGLLIFALTIPFDIRDLSCDSERLQTLPARLSLRKSVQVAICALVVSAVIPWISWWYLDAGTGLQAFAYSAWCAIASGFIYKSSPERHEYYFSFAMDGLILLLWGMFRLAEVR